jgi:hypothetical protein
MTAELVNEIDTFSPDQNVELHGKVDDYCMRLQVMMDEWKLESVMKEDKSEDIRILVADHVMTIYSFMIGIRRLVRQQGSEDPVDNFTLGAARKVVQYSIDFTIDPDPDRRTNLGCIQYVEVRKFSLIESNHSSQLHQLLSLLCSLLTIRAHSSLR